MVLLQIYKGTITLKKAIVVLMIILSFIYWRNTFVVIRNNKAFNTNVNSITQDKVFFNDITPFEWDAVYTFGPYTSRKVIEEAIDIKSNDINEALSEGMQQLIFVKEDKIICSITEYYYKLGYMFFIKSYKNEYGTLNSTDNPLFKIERKDGLVKLIYVEN